MFPETSGLARAIWYKILGDNIERITANAVMQQCSGTSRLSLYLNGLLNTR
jgi:hypothetical protein